MNQLITSNQPLTMTTVDFLESIINPARAKAGESAVRYNDFLTRAKDEVDVSHNEIFAMESTGGRSRQVFNLDYDRMMLIGMRESKAVRRNVLEKIKQLASNDPQQPKLPQTKREWIEFALEQEKKLELAAPKVAFVDNLVERNTLMTATQVAQKHKISAVKLNRFLDELGCVYSKAVKRGRVFKQKFVDNGYGEMKQTDLGHSQALFTPAGEVWINQQLVSEGMV